MSDIEFAVRRFVEAFNASDWSGLAGLLAEDVAYDPAGGERLIGRQAVHEHLALQARKGRRTLEDLAVFRTEDAPRAALECTLRLDAAPDGARTRRAAALFFDIDDGWISRITAYERPAG
ncbi:nuclear transport factor 2 family protein [Mangrovibrevibacter kandeliae]|uniref:nuclear transport factor 2 family protein n=1 Tax=Mangrovibrevibacter kandeliae TaxID=2968473 RepID=UPI002118BC65|nr:nuclear transport factor 2 family protein [Aurantimonas sp. CSK15Z-1]MCQ8784116.1 nuclear transport factor 2 family protein [Aurantimonas sp. CSK15Z-1]